MIDMKDGKHILVRSSFQLYMKPIIEEYSWMHTNGTASVEAWALVADAFA